MNPSWKTTTCGAIALAGTIVAAADFGPLANKIAGCLASFGTGLGLLFARDNGVTSEQVQAAKNKNDTSPSPVPPTNNQLPPPTAGG